MLASSRRYGNRVFAAQSKPSILRKEVIEKLSTDVTSVQKTLARNINIPLSSLKQLIEESVKFNNEAVIRTLLCRRDITVELVKNLYNSKNACVRYASAVLANDFASGDVLEIIVDISKKDKVLTRYIVRHAPEHSNLNKDTFNNLISQRENYSEISYTTLVSKNMTEQLFELLSNNYSERTRNFVKILRIK